MTTQHVIFDYKNLWLIYNERCYFCNTLAELRGLQGEFLEATKLTTKH